MADHVIEIDPLNPFSVLTAQRELDRLVRDFDKKIDEFIQELGKIGQQAAQGAYGNAVTVTLERDGDGVTISANGKAVVFLEFGAGSKTDATDRYASEMPFPVYRGSYSDAVQGEYQKNNYQYWMFGGQKIQYVEPRNGMQKAYEAIMQDIENVAKRVFG